jgi:DNA-binding NtrC family response regulator
MGNSPARILIADDEAAVREILSEYLARLGFAVEACASPEEALARLKAEPAGFALAVLDGTMAGVESSAIAAEILRANPTLRVIVTSGYPVDLEAVMAAAPGRAAFLPKPFSSSMLTSLTRRLLGAEKEEL